jgi:hypothetical protein
VSDPLEGVLTPRQEQALQDLQAVDAGARIVGWNRKHNGPVVEFSDGTRRIIGLRGKLVPKRRKEGA